MLQLFERLILTIMIVNVNLIEGAFYEIDI